MLRSILLDRSLCLIKVYAPNVRAQSREYDGETSNALQIAKTKENSIALGWFSRVMEGGTRRLMHGLVKQTHFCVSFIAV